MSSVTGEGIDQFVQLIAATAMRLPHVNQIVPKSYVDLGSLLEGWSKELIAAGSPPVRTRTEVDARIKSNAELSRHLVQSDPHATTRALEFLASGGVLVLAHNSTALILDPGWLADTLACVITVDPTRLLKLPPALLQRGMLRHTDNALAAVWPVEKGFGGGLRKTLLSMLHRFDLALVLRDAEDASVGYSLVPSMLPPGPAGSVHLDHAIGPVAGGQSEVGVEYHLGYLPPE